MERLEAKRIKGHTYYYYSKWEWVDGRCRRVWQRYLGTAPKIAQVVEGGGPAPKYAEVFQWGLPTALWQQCARSDVVQRIDRGCPKRGQGLSTGQYLAIAAVNRAMCPKSKRSMWDWFSQTVLLRYLPGASRASLTSQRFWDHMDRIDELSETYLGKNLLITDRDDWDDAQIIRAYRSQFLIEDVFKQTKDRETGNWWPLHHWTDSKIRVHALYCSLALLLRAIMLRQVKAAGLRISTKRLLQELDAIREVVNIYPRTGNQKTERKQTVLTKTSELQAKLMAILGIDRTKTRELG